MATLSDTSVFLGIDHPAVAAADVDALADWYCQVLGYEQLFRDDKPVWILRAADGTLLEVMPQDDTPRPDRTTWTPGWSHLAIRVSDFDRAQRQLETRGVPWMGEEVAAMGGGRVRSFADPDGNMVQILERPGSRTLDSSQFLITLLIQTLFFPNRYALNSDHSGGPNMKHLVPTALLLGSLLSIPALAGETQQGPLADYVAKPDDSYSWRIKRSGDVGSAAYTELILTSQTWQNMVWKHQLFVIKPASLQVGTKHALLFITGGSWKDALETNTGESSISGEIRLLAALAEQLKTPVVVVRQVPRQPIFDGKYEDAIIAYTFEQYLKTGDAEWPLLLPMVKSAVRAMDAAQQFTRQEWSLDIKTFTVTGASKRGWTTWLTSATDRRVTALAPMVIDMLNMSPQLEHQEAVWGEPSDEISDYTERGLHKILRTEKGRALQQIVDPYQYRRQLTQPKLILLGTNDPYWPLDALNLYWSDLLGEKYILYIPDNGHGLNDYGRLFGSLNALHQHAARGQTLPKLTWQFQRQDGKLHLTVQSEPAADKVVAWTTTAPTRDFRQSKWGSSVAATNGQKSVIELSDPKEGFAAVFGEARYSLDGVPYYFSTNVRIVSAEE